MENWRFSVMDGAGTQTGSDFDAGTVSMVYRYLESVVIGGLQISDATPAPRRHPGCDFDSFFE